MPITDANALPARRYLEERLGDAMWASASLRGGVAARQEAAATLPKDAEGLAAWASEHLTETGRERLQAALRQRRYITRHRQRALKLPAETMDRLRDYASEHGLTLAEAVEQLLGEE